MPQKHTGHYYYSPSLSQMRVSAVAVTHLTPSRTCSSPLPQACQPQKQKIWELVGNNQMLVLPLTGTWTGWTKGWTGSTWSGSTGLHLGRNNPVHKSGTNHLESSFSRREPLEETTTWTQASISWAALGRALPAHRARRPFPSAQSWWDTLGALRPVLGSPL